MCLTKKVEVEVEVEVKQQQQEEGEEKQSLQFVPYLWMKNVVKR